MVCCQVSNGTNCCVINSSQPQDPFLSIILVLIPTVLGAILTPVLAQWLQNRSLKIGRKKELVDSFVESIKQSFLVEDNLLRIIAEHYATVDIKNMLEKSEVEFKFNKFPENEKEFPGAVFRDQIKQAEGQLQSIRINSSYFISKARLYVEDKNFLEKYNEIHRYLGTTWFEIKQLMEVTTKEQFISSIKELQEMRGRTKKLIESFEDYIIKIKIRNISV